MRPTSGVWLFTTGGLYTEAIVINVLQGNPVPSVVLQLAWLLIMSLPLFVSALANFLDMKTITQT